MNAIFLLSNFDGEQAHAIHNAGETIRKPKSIIQAGLGSRFFIHWMLTEENKAAHEKQM